MQSVEKSRIAILISPYPSLAHIFVLGMVRNRRKAEGKSNVIQLALLIEGIFASTKTEGHRVIN